MPTTIQLNPALRDNSNLKFNIDYVMKKYQHKLVGKNITSNNTTSLSKTILVPKLKIEQIPVQKIKKLPHTDRVISRILRENPDIFEKDKFSDHNFSSYLNVAQKIATKIYAEKSTNASNKSQPKQKNNPVKNDPVKLIGLKKINVQKDNLKKSVASGFGQKLRKLPPYVPPQNHTNFSLNFQETSRTVMQESSLLDGRKTIKAIDINACLSRKKSEKVEMLQKIYSPSKFSIKRALATHQSPFKKTMLDISKSSRGSCEDEYNVWDNTDLTLKGVDLNNSNPSFLNILKMRIQNFPLQKQFFCNKDVVDFARNLVGCEKINNDILNTFDDRERYDVPNNLKKDVNCLKFLNLYYRIRMKDQKAKIHQLFPNEKKVILRSSKRKILRDSMQKLESHRKQKTFLEKVREEYKL